MGKIIPLLFVIGMLTGGSLTSCKRYPVDPPDTTHKCDTCCDTCKTDTTIHPCDTCNINKDSAAHAFIWTEYTIPSESNLTGVWVFGPNEIILNGGTLWHFDGTSFEKIDGRDATHNNAALNGAMSGYNIFAFSPTNYWLVDGSDFLHTNDGTYFDDYRAGSVSTCWGSIPNDVFFVGNAGHITHWDGTKFEEMNSGTTKNLQSVWGISHNNVWAAGFNPSTAESVLLHYNGSLWASIDLSSIGDIDPGRHTIDGVWVTDSLGHSVVVAGGTLLWRQTDNQQWRSDSGKIHNGSGKSFIGLYDIRGNNANDFVATGDGGFISHWNGKTWKRYDEIYNGSNTSYITNAASMKGNTISVVGAKNGKSWIAVGRRK